MHYFVYFVQQKYYLNYIYYTYMQYITKKKNKQTNFPQNLILAISSLILGVLDFRYYQPRKEISCGAECTNILTNSAL